MPHLFEPFTLRSVTLRNRVGVSPMCQYSGGDDGCASDWHLVHLGARAVGGAGLILTEDTAVSRQGRITPGDNGLWSDAQIEPLARITRFLSAHGAVPGVQLGHAGRKGSTTLPWAGGTPPGTEGRSLTPEEGAWETIAPSPLPYGGERSHVPREMTPADIRAVQEDFARAARRAREAGFRWLELHAAWGYLCQQFYSPRSNHRTDEYGGSLDNRLRFTLEVVRALRREWPDELPLAVRLAVTEWLDDGFGAEESIELARRLKGEGVDLIDCISAGAAPHAKVPWGSGFNVPLSEAVRRGAGIPTATVGFITDARQADEIVRNGRADVVLLAREFLRDAAWPVRAARALGQDPSVAFPLPYQWWL